MRLAIADPPYLGRAHWYSDTGRRGTGFRSNGRMDRPADHHPAASEWDDPARHAMLVAELLRDFDGFAVAMARDSLPVYLAAMPEARIAVWHNPAAWPPGGRVHATWEPVALQIPCGRRALRSAQYVKDVLIAVPPRHEGFIGAKPAAWTRWVLDMLGYDAAVDTVDDLFPGSGAVTREIAQGTLDLDGPALRAGRAHD